MCTAITTSSDTELAPAVGQLNESDPTVGDFVESSIDFELMMGLLSARQEVLLYETGTVTVDLSNGAVILFWDG